MTDIYAIVEGVATLLTGGEEDLCWVEEIDDAGMAPVKRLTQRGPQQHGDTDIGFRLEPRTFSLVLGMNVTPSTLYTQRAALLALFKPRTSALALKWVLPDAAVRQIDCHYAGQLALKRDGWMGSYQPVAVVLRAADPLFYDPTQQVSDFVLGGGGAAFVVPIVVPMAVGASTLNETKEVIYPGTFRDFPRVTIAGPITDAVITNLTTGDKLDFTGYTLGTGYSLTVDCRFGHKTVLRNDGTNLIDKLTDDSDLATFCLEAAPDAPEGANLINVVGTTVTAATSVSLAWFNRYIGL